MLGEKAAYEARKIYDFFTEGMIIWLAGLWEPQIGGFYFSNSARDYEGFLPDIESTVQALNFIGRNMCAGDAKPELNLVPERFLEKACAFVLSLQDEDGFFYHPQWGKNISPTRRGRDLGWARTLILGSGRKYKYPSPYDRAKDENGKVAALPEHFSSIEAYREWLSTKNLRTHSYPIGHLFNSTSTQVRVAGPEFVQETLDWFDRYQIPETGLWEPEVNYRSVNGLMKIVTTYPGLGGKFKYAENAFNSAKAALLSSEPVEFSCQFYNAWCAMRTILDVLENQGNGETAERLRRELIEDAPALIRATREKMALAACDDGSFAYFTSTSGKFCTTSQGASVALPVREGDVNGNGCSTRAPLSHMFAAFGLETPPMFTSEDGELLFELMDARVSVKKRPLPKT